MGPPDRGPGADPPSLPPPLFFFGACFLAELPERLGKWLTGSLAARRLPGVQFAAGASRGPAPGRRITTNTGLDHNRHRPRQAGLRRTRLARPRPRACSAGSSLAAEASAGSGASWYRGTQRQAARRPCPFWGIWFCRLYLRCEMISQCGAAVDERTQETRPSGALVCFCFVLVTAVWPGCFEGARDNT